MRRGIQIKFKQFAEAAESLDVLVLEYTSGQHKRKQQMSRGIIIKFKHIAETAKSLDVLI